jgi:hypothetical protein
MPCSFITQRKIADAEARRKACRIFIPISIQTVAKLGHSVPLAIEGTVALRDGAEKPVEEEKANPEISIQTALVVQRTMMDFVQPPCPYKP